MIETIFNIACVIFFSYILSVGIVFFIDYYKKQWDEKYLVIIPMVVILVLFGIGEIIDANHREKDNDYQRLVNETMQEIYNETSMEDVREDIDRFFYENERDFEMPENDD